MRVWIDLANSPHPLLFEPIAAELREAGHETLITVRDHAQTVELARERFDDPELIGAPREERRGAAGRELRRRAWALSRWARRHRPDVALSHNSYAQISAVLLAALAPWRPIRIVTAMDYEHQPANHLAFRLADRILVPDCLPAGPLRRQGARERKLRRYPGFKEEVYLGRAEPDPAILERVGLEPAEGERLVVARSAAAGAAYHRDDNPLFESCLRDLAARPGVRTVVLARHASQRRQVRALGLERCLVPEGALDAHSLLSRADLFLGAGGTMTREAALLGVPTLSIFAGERPAVDAELERLGRLRRISDPAEIGEVRAREHGAAAGRRQEIRERGARIRAAFVAAVTEVAGG